MYIYSGSWLKQVKSNTPYSNINISGMLIGDILNRYQDGYIILTNTALTKPVYLSLNQLRSTELPLHSNLSFNSWLTSIGNATLVADTVKPVYKTGIVKSRDSMLAGFSVDLCEANKLPGTNGAVGNKVNLFIKHPWGNNEILRKQCLVTVNGFLHRSSAFDTGIQVHGGGWSMLHAGNNNVGVISFEEIGDIIQVPLVSTMLHKPSPGIPYYKQVVVDLDVSLSNKSIILSLGGYVFVAPPFVQVISPENGLIEIDMSVLDIPLKVAASRKHIDLSALGLGGEMRDERTFGKMRPSEINSDPVVHQWLTLPQSFIVVVDTPMLTVEYESLQRTGVYGVFEYHKNPFLPLVDIYGRMQEYWVNRQNDAWVVKIKDPLYYPRLYETSDNNKDNYVNDITPYHAVFKNPPELMRITSTKKI